MCAKGKCISLCGDGKLSDSETCDDGTWDNIGCNEDCTEARPGFNCTGGTNSTATQCKEICGDGLNVGEEVCDDGNTIDGDGCKGDCKKIED